MSFPKCGQTWIQEIVWTLVNNPDLDNPNASKMKHVRTPFLEYV